jgi:hypothetical protein
MSEPVNNQCRNCNFVLSSKYCPECGQKDKHYEPTINQWLLTIWDDFISIDAKLFNTFKALITPGQYASDWLDGKQKRYVHPIRLYIFLSITLSVLHYFGLSSELFLSDYLSGFSTGLIAGTEHPQAGEHIYNQQILQVVSILLLPITVVSAQIYDRKSFLVKSIFFVVCLFSFFTLLLLLHLLVTHIITKETFRLFITIVVLCGALLFTIFSAKRVYKKNMFSTTITTSLFILVNIMMLTWVVMITQGFNDAHNEPQTIEPNNTLSRNSG